jgi:hypothetical protein
MAPRLDVHFCWCKILMGKVEIRVAIGMIRRRYQGLMVFHEKFSQRNPIVA